ncbi:MULTISPECIES: TetR/AcrR family transcriptional regulator [Streptomyces]|uniref:TetR family transcriptional regulator n=1 Tax=Streptomyces lasiicapitis TaxID=1923961 RepID=A0ABQ2LP61_9ACTN|nr:MULTISPECIES: TetR/AcrR family transcriptional regulator [Streptomyces]QIB47364.1 TetR/AcrR family transcriptional regulator [Streptomyces aureoverticillatus]GGO41255.1 TetR family transcriptional regulator [Streptomyces lasiicapitis]
MARPRTFDEERALDAAMRAFWANGYEATSTQDLCEATGLGRSSIYNTFTSKHDLFRRALARYIDVMSVPQAEILEDAERPGLERIRALFARIVDTEFDYREDDERSIGCLTVNTVVELARRDPEAAALVERDLDFRLGLLRVALEAGRRDGTVTTGRDPDTLARFINATIGGMRVSAQAGAGRAVLESIADTALDALRP